MSLKDYLKGTCPEGREEVDRKLKKQLPEWALRDREEGIHLVRQATALEDVLNSREKIGLLEEARKKFIRSRSVDLLIPTVNMIADEFADVLGKFQPALDLYEANFNLAKDLGMVEDMVDTLILMAYCYIFAKDFDQAADCFRRAHDIALETKDHALIAEVEYAQGVLKLDFLISKKTGKMYPINNGKKEKQET